MNLTAKTQAEAMELVKTQIAPGMKVMHGVGNPYYQPHVQVVFSPFEAFVTVKPQGDEYPREHYTYHTIRIGA